MHRLACDLLQNALALWKTATPDPQLQQWLTGAPPVWKQQLFIRLLFQIAHLRITSRQTTAS
eukprot:9702170-Prorocentrum_lima.AAC.1